MSDWIDISVPLVEGITQWTGDPLFQSSLVADMTRGDEANVTAIGMCAHTGTHIDAPRHYFSDASGVEDIQPEVLIGEACVVALDEDWGDAKRVLFRTSNSDSEWWREPFRHRFPTLTPELAQRMVERGVVLVGIDYLSVGENTPEGAEVHRILLRANVCLLEGLNLCQASPGIYELVCLPIRLEGADGAPARAFLRRP